MAAPDNNARPLGSKPHVKLTTADLERMCGIQPHAEKKCDYCGIPLAFPRTFTKDTFCAVCSSLLNALMQSKKSYWFNVQREFESGILADIIHKKLLLDSREDFGECGGDEIR